MAGSATFRAREPVPPGPTAIIARSPGGVVQPEDPMLVWLLRGPRLNVGSLGGRGNASVWLPIIDRTLTWDMVDP